MFFIPSLLISASCWGLHNPLKNRSAWCSLVPMCRVRSTTFPFKMTVYVKMFNSLAKDWMCCYFNGSFVVTKQFYFLIPARWIILLSKLSQLLLLQPYSWTLLLQNFVRLCFASLLLGHDSISYFNYITSYYYNKNDYSRHLIFNYR